MSFRRARLQFIVLMLITSHWFACIWGMCADLQGEDYESFTWLDALYYATEAQVGRGRVGIFVNLPHSAHLVEVTSTTVQDAHHGLFEELSPSMCQTAMRLTQPSAALTTLWSELGDVDEDAGGLPSLLAVSVMVPSELAEGRRALPAQVRPQRGLALARQVELGRAQARPAAVFMRQTSSKIWVNLCQNF